MIDITKPLRFRDETDNREVHYLAGLPDGRLVFAMHNFDGYWTSVTRCKDGRFRSGRDGRRDIINVPETRTLPEMWANVYTDRRITLHYSRREADSFAVLAETRIACVHLTGIEYKVGEGLDGDEPPGEASAP